MINSENSSLKTGSWDSGKVPGFQVKPLSTGEDDIGSNRLFVDAAVGRIRAKKVMLRTVYDAISVSQGLPCYGKARGLCLQPPVRILLFLQ
jgi:hypothetical protein